MMLQFNSGRLAELLGDWRQEAGSLYEALASGIAALIAAGDLPPDSRLPSERQLASTLQISRGTVMAAYDQLRDRSLVTTRQGSGTVVTRAGSPVSGPREAHVASTLAHESIYRGFLGLDDDQIDLRGAYWADADDLPDEAFELAVEQLRSARASHGYSLFGVPALREAVARHLTDAGLDTSPDQVLVTTGAQQAIALLTQLTVGPGDIVAVEEATYPGALEIFAAQHARLVPVALSRAGADLSDLRRIVGSRRPRLVYLIPSVNNPTGVTMPGPARARLAELAAGWDTLIVDDRTLADTQWEGPRPAPLAAYATPDVAERVVTIGSVSKTLWGGLRVGWLRADGPILHRLGRLKSLLDLGTPIASQLIAANLLGVGDPLFARRRRAMQAHGQLLSDALADRVDGWRWQPPTGGLCLWVDLAGASAAEFCHVAADHGIGLVPGAVASPGGDTASSHIRVPFGQPVDVLTEAADRLAAAWQDYRSRLAGHPGRTLSVVV